MSEPVRRSMTAALKTVELPPEALALIREGSPRPLATKPEPKAEADVAPIADEMEPSPDGKKVAFGLRGDIWTVLVEKPKGVAGRGSEFAKRLTDWVGDDSDFNWSPDGKKLYFTSDRDFNTRLYEMEVSSLKTKCLWAHDEDVTGARVSPDGKQLGFWVSGREGGLYVMPVENGEPRRIVKVPGPQWRGVGGGDYAWSPDMKWIAYNYRGESRACRSRPG